MQLFPLIHAKTLPLSSNCRDPQPRSASCCFFPRGPGPPLAPSTLPFFFRVSFPFTPVSPFLSIPLPFLAQYIYLCIPRVYFPIFPCCFVSRAACILPLPSCLEKAPSPFADYRGSLGLSKPMPSCSEALQAGQEKPEVLEHSEPLLVVFAPVSSLPTF